MDLVEFIRGLTTQIIAIAWVVFLITWVIGWALRGSPIPIHRVKRLGQSLIEDSVIAAFWLALGSTVFALIAFIASNVSQPFPPPPTSTPTPQP